MKGKLGILLMCLGTVLLVAALSLFLYNNAQSRQARRLVADLLPQVVQHIGEAPAQAPTEPVQMVQPNDDGAIELPSLSLPILIPGLELEPTAAEPPKMTAIQVEGHDYIGFLSIPDLGLELPVMSDWNYNKLKIAPCRYAGSLLTDDLVVMAHNYTSHFGKLKNLPVGALLSFTDMSGVTTEYQVAAIEVLAPDAIEDMTAGEFALTLFTCTYDRNNRVTVRCDRLTDQ